MTPLERYRDDGPLARALAPLGEGLAPSALAFAGAAGVLAALAGTGARGSNGLIVCAVAWLVLLGGASRGGSLERDRFGWAVPPLLRTGEYALVLWISSAGCAEGPAAGFALLVVLAFRHYDLVYRPRHQGAGPAAWLDAVSGGWDGRLVVAWLLLVAGALPAGLYVLAALLGVLFAGECVAGWRRFAGGGPGAASLYIDEGEAE